MEYETQIKRKQHQKLAVNIPVSIIACTWSTTLFLSYEYFKADEAERPHGEDSTCINGTIRQFIAGERPFHFVLYNTRAVYSCTNHLSTENLLQTHGTFTEGCLLQSRCNIAEDMEEHRRRTQKYPQTEKQFQEWFRNIMWLKVIYKTLCGKVCVFYFNNNRRLSNPLQCIFKNKEGNQLRNRTRQ